MGKLTTEQLAQVRQEQSSESGSDVTTILLEHQFVSSDDILAARAQQHGLEFRHIKAEDVEKEAFEKLEIDFIKTNSICPIAIDGETLIVATSEPANVFAIEDVKRQIQMPLQVVVCSAEEIEAVCNSLEQSEGLEYCVDEIISDLADIEVNPNGNAPVPQM